MDLLQAQQTPLIHCQDQTTWPLVTTIQQCVLSINMDALPTKTYTHGAM